jgi:uncharacterized protein (DUF433 family)
LTGALFLVVLRLILESTSTEDRIARTQGVHGGKACIAGHRVRVLDIVVWHEHQGVTPDEAVSHVPTITLGDFRAALACYFDRMEEIRQEMRAERAFAEESRRSHPSLLEAKLRQERLEEAP